MKRRSRKKTIPTLLAIFVLILGITSGVILVNARQIFKLGAEETSAPKNIRVSNITDDGFCIGFFTNKNTRTFVKISADKFFLTDVQTMREDSQTNVHYFKTKDLKPEKEYFFLINSDGLDYYKENPMTATTGKKISFKPQGGIIYGKIYSKSGEEHKNAIVYVRGGNGSLVSTKTSEDGSFMISTSQIRKSDLSSYETFDEEKTIINVLVEDSRDTSTITTNLKNSYPLPPIIIGQNLDLRQSTSNADYTIPLPSVFGISTNNIDIPFFIKNIYKERLPNLLHE